MSGKGDPSTFVILLCSYDSFISDEDQDDVIGDENNNPMGT